MAGRPLAGCRAAGVMVRTFFLLSFFKITFHDAFLKRLFLNRKAKRPKKGGRGQQASKRAFQKAHHEEEKNSLRNFHSSKDQTRVKARACPPATHEKTSKQVSDCLTARACTQEGTCNRESTAVRANAWASANACGALSRAVGEPTESTMEKDRSLVCIFFICCAFPFLPSSPTAVCHLQLLK